MGESVGQIRSYLSYREWAMPKGAHPYLSQTA